MKTFFTILLVYLFINVNAQSLLFKGRHDISPYGLDYESLLIQLGQNEFYPNITQITYFDLNFVEQRMQEFMRNKMGMEVAHFPSFSKDNGNTILTVRYVGQATMGTSEIQSLVFRYTLFDNKGKHTIIKSLHISGTANKVVYFYAAFWPTTMNFDGTKTKIAHNFLWQDKATISFNGSWSISIENTTIHSLDEYYAELTKNSTLHINLENDYAKKQAFTRDSTIKTIKKASAYHDSLINVAQGYGIPYSQKKDDANPPVDWLKMVIKDKEDRLNSGNNYNDSKIDSLIPLVEKIQPDKHTYITGVLYFRIDTNGVINQVVIGQELSTVTTSLLNAINKAADGIKVEPYIVNGKSFPSYKRYAIQFIPTTMREFSFFEAPR